MPLRHIQNDMPQHLLPTQMALLWRVVYVTACLESSTHTLKRPFWSHTQTPSISTPALQSEALKYSHVLVAILDANPSLSSASQLALTTGASLATTGRLSVVFVDETQQTAEIKSARTKRVQQ